MRSKGGIWKGSVLGWEKGLSFTAAFASAVFAAVSVLAVFGASPLPFMVAQAARATETAMKRGEVTGAPRRNAAAVNAAAEGGIQAFLPRSRRSTTPASNAARRGEQERWLGLGRRRVGMGWRTADG